MVDVVDPGRGAAWVPGQSFADLSAEDSTIPNAGGPSFADLSQQAAAAGFTLPDTDTDPTSPTNVGYWAGKIADFQATLVALDATYQQLVAAQAINSDPDIDAQIGAWLGDFSLKRAFVRTTAEGLNLAAATANSLGASMPSVQIPGTLGLLPAIPLSAIAIFAAAAVVAYWGSQMIHQGGAILQNMQATSACQGDPSCQAQVAALIAQNANTGNQGFLASLGDTGNLVKWVLIGGALWFAWREFGGSGRSGGRGG